MKAFNELSDTEKEALMRGSFGTELVNVIQPCVAPLYWQKAGSSDAASSGSAFFVNTGAALFGVTAKHVYDAFAEEANLDPSIVCQFYNFPLADLRSRLISRRRECDVATFEILPSEISRLDRCAAPWPPSIPPKGKSVVFAGFPGSGKKMNASGEMTFGMFKSMTNVDSLSEHDISLLRPPDDQVTDVDGKGLPPHDIDLSGMSGGPLFTVLDGAGIVSWALAGVIYEYGAQFEIINAVKADVIGDDGKING